MAKLLHLSDLHLVIDPLKPRKDLLSRLVEAVAASQEAQPKLTGIIVSGDVCDSSTLPVEQAAWVFANLLERIRDACGVALPAFIVPGNHDRRGSGVFGPQSGDLFRELQKQLGKHAVVHGCEAPFLARLLRANASGIGLDMVLYDSTWLPRGKFSAGGVIQQEDLLQIAGQLEGSEDDGPLLLVLHHHLIPTALTDVGMIELEGQNPLVRFAVRGILPRLVAHADREELTMTALGTGSALSTLQSFGRAILVLHGHKHYPTPRLLRAVEDDDGDLLIASAGSAGIEERWRTAGESSQLWPSFNVVQVDASQVDIQTVAFSPRETGRLSVRTLVHAQRDGRHWKIAEQAPRQASSSTVSFARNEARFRLTENATDKSRWDLAVERTLEPQGGVADDDFEESVEAAPGALVSFEGVRSQGGCRVKLRANQINSYQVRRGAFRTIDALFASAPEQAPFGSVLLHVRKGSKLARLSLQVDKGIEIDSTFASTTDLTTGIESHARLVRSGPLATLQCADVAAQTLLRIYWPLERV